MLIVFCRQYYHFIIHLAILSVYEDLYMHVLWSAFAIITM
jgi:hypothetical protein